MNRAINGCTWKMWLDLLLIGVLNGVSNKIEMADKPHNTHINLQDGKFGVTLK